ncbi:MAG: hypothetical protein ABH879_01365 [archaeon]
MSLPIYRSIEQAIYRTMQPGKDDPPVRITEGLWEFSQFVNNEVDKHLGGIVRRADYEWGGVLVKPTGAPMDAPFERIAIIDQRVTPVHFTFTHEGDRQYKEFIDNTREKGEARWKSGGYIHRHPGRSGGTRPSSEDHEMMPVHLNKYYTSQEFYVAQNRDCYIELDGNTLIIRGQDGAFETSVTLPDSADPEFHAKALELLRLSIDALAEACGTPNEGQNLVKKAFGYQAGIIIDGSGDAGLAHAWYNVRRWYDGKKVIADDVSAKDSAAPLGSKKNDPYFKRLELVAGTLDFDPGIIRQIIKDRIHADIRR